MAAPETRDMRDGSSWGVRDSGSCQFCPENGSECSDWVNTPGGSVAT